LRLRLVKLGLRRLEGRLAPLQLRTADEVLVLQGGIAPGVGGSQVAVGERRGHLRPCRIGGQPQVLRIELRQHVTGLHPLTWLGRTSPANSGAESKLLAPTVITFTARIGSCGAGAGEQPPRTRATKERLRLDRRKRSLGKGMANLLEEEWVEAWARAVITD
jgi:hypothetical protein